MPFFAAVMSLLFIMMAAVAEPRVNVHDVRLWRAPDSTRVVFDLDNAVTHSLQTLENPHRIVLDIANTSIATNLNKLPLQGTPITALRTSLQANGDLRVVLDLSTAVRAKSFFLKKNAPMDDRLVLDLIDIIETKEKEADDIASLLKAQTKAVKAQIAQPTKVSEPPSIPSTHRRDLIVAIDAGHGGEDPGAIGPNRIREKDVVMQISQKVFNNFSRQKGYKPVLVRRGDYYVGLTQRRDIAQKANADIFVSIHADAFTRSSANGSSVYALSSSGATSASAQFLADKENQSDLMGGVSLDDKDAVLSSVLVDLSMTYKMESSLEVGAGVLRKMGNISRLHSTKVEQAAFAVLKTLDIPSILVETGFISNHAEAKKLSSSAYQQKMADAIYDGVHEYFLRKAPEDTYIAWLRTQKPVESFHVVAKGETLSEISRRYAISMQTLLAYNALPTSNIRIGQKLKIPSR